MTVGRSVCFQCFFMFSTPPPTWNRVVKLNHNANSLFCCWNYLESRYIYCWSVKRVSFSIFGGLHRLAMHISKRAFSPRLRLSWTRRAASITDLKREQHLGVNCSGRKLPCVANTWSQHIRRKNGNKNEIPIRYGKKYKKKRKICKGSVCAHKGMIYMSRCGLKWNLNWKNPWRLLKKIARASIKNF